MQPLTKKQVLKLALASSHHAPTKLHPTPLHQTPHTQSPGTGSPLETPEQDLPKLEQQAWGVWYSMIPHTEPQPMKQPPPQTKVRIEKFPRHGPIVPAPDAWHGPHHVKTDHEISLNQHSHKPERMQAVEKETEERLGEAVDGWRPLTATLMGAG